MRKNNFRHSFIRHLVKSGRQDSNLRPSAPKADALAGLRYAPISFSGQLLDCPDLLQDSEGCPEFFPAEDGGFEPPIRLFNRMPV